MSDSKIARTGRVQSWIDDPSEILPVSCTVDVVKDQMWGERGITDSWHFTTHGLQKGAGVAVHLSELRPSGTDNGKGLVASGPVPFMPVWSDINGAVRKGGKYKNGAVVLHLDLSHPDVLEFITLDRRAINYAKRCVNINQSLWDHASPEVKKALIAGIAAGDVWLAKTRHDQWGRRIYANVCLEIFLRPRGTCLLEHINLGACEIDELADAFKAGMLELVDLHARTGVGESGWYLSPKEDRQVGLGMLGLANLLALERVKYAEFADALEDHLNYKDGSLHNCTNPTAVRIVEALAEGIQGAAEIARSAQMDRAFTIAPTASCSYRHTDRAGYTTAPEIAPPIGRIVDRDSTTFGVTQVDYGTVETAEQVGWPVYVRVANAIMQLLQNTGLCHGYSFNSWSDVVHYDEAFIESWLESPQTSLYYSLQVMGGTQAKDDALAALESAEEDFSDVFEFCTSCAE